MEKRRMMEADMSKAWNIAKRMKRGGLLLALLIIVLTDCQGSLLTYKGAWVSGKYRIALEDGTQRSGSYQSPDLTIEYQWERSGNELQLSGTAEFTSEMRNSYDWISSFHLSVFFTDAQGIILEGRGIPTPGCENLNNRMRFSEKLLLPPGTANMAFGYSGQARDSGSGGKGGSGEISFGQVPIVR
jgi:hypothetical protein